MNMENNVLYQLLHQNSKVLGTWRTPATRNATNWDIRGSPWHAVSIAFVPPTTLCPACHPMRACATARPVCAMLTNPAHCRRRKIRCLLAENNSQQRCGNCIKLKKKCVFYPVDPQNVIERPSQPSNKVGAGSLPSSVVPSSPPELGSGRPFDRIHRLGSFPSLPSNVPPESPGSALEPGGALPGQDGTMPGFLPPGMSNFETGAMPPLGFQQTPVDGRAPCEQSDGFRSSLRNSMNVMDGDLQPPPYWRSGPTGPSGEFTPFFGAGPRMPPPIHDNMSTSYTSSNPHVWHPSQEARSIPYGNTQDAEQSGHMPSNVGYQPMSAQEVEPVQAATYAPLVVNRATAQGAVGGPRSARVGTLAMPFGQRHHFAFQAPVTVSAYPRPSQQ